LKLRYETKTIIAGDDTEFPEFSFNHAYSGVGIEKGQKVSVSYMVPADNENAIKAMAAEITAHLMGLYK
jgi:hypothetical protein